MTATEPPTSRPLTLLARVLGTYALLVGSITAVGWFTRVKRLTDWDGDGIADPACYGRATGRVTVRSSLLRTTLFLQAAPASTSNVEVAFGRFNASARGGMVLRDGNLVKVYDFSWGCSNGGCLTNALNNEIARLVATLQANLNNEIARVALPVRSVY